MKKSIWQDEKRTKKYPKIVKDQETDILIIGAGITGITLAYFLKDSKFKTILIDREAICNEASAKNMGKVTYMQGFYHKIQEIYDYNISFLYYKSQKKAIKIIKKNINDNNINCDFKKVYTSVYFDDLKKLSKESQILSSFKVNMTSKKNTLSVKNSYVFNPLKYLLALASIMDTFKNVNIYENSMATKIRREEDFYVVYVNGYEIKTKILVIATNFPFFTIPFLAPLKLYTQKAMMHAVKTTKIKNVSGIASKENGFSFRYYENDKAKSFLFLDKIKNVSDYFDTSKKYSEVLNKIGKDKLCYSWINTDTLTFDHLPIIGRVSDDDKNVFIGTGYNTWGMTNGTLAAFIINNLINNKKNGYDDIFSTTKWINRNTYQSFLKNDFIKVSKAYVRGFINKKDLRNRNVSYITKINKKRVGIYKDSDGKNHVVSNICPHLKCCLIFNEFDKTWDCPCHASRFDVDGNVVSGPSCKNIKL